MTTFTAEFSIDAWDQAAYDEPADGPVLARAAVHKTFTGALEGTSTAEVLLCGDTGFLASERVTGTLDGRAGTFVLQHGGLAPADAEPYAFGSVVPGSGTGALAGLTGSVTYAHDEAGARITLDVQLP
jgi:hypothetical protein